MTQLTAEQVDRTIEACRTRLAEVAETFRAKLDCNLRLTAGGSRPYVADAVSPYDGPGLAVSFVLGEQGVLLLVPEPIPLPAWYRNPGISENNRLQTFAHELSLQLLPADLQADRYSATAPASLKEFAEAGQVGPTTAALDLPVFQAEGDDSDSPIATILVIVGFNTPPAAIEAEGGSTAGLPRQKDADDPSVEEPSALSSSAASGEETRDNTASLQSAKGVSAETGLSLDQALRALRILNVPVTVSVRLAERKMPLGQIVALVPGALVPFNKSCEDLLDLFVNNYHYCQGEAIKIGENFGLKIAKVGVTDERKEHVL